MLKNPFNICKHMLHMYLMKAASQFDCFLNNKRHICTKLHDTHLNLSLEGLAAFWWNSHENPFTGFLILLRTYSQTITVHGC